MVACRGSPGPELAGLLRTHEIVLRAISEREVEPEKSKKKLDSGHGSKPFQLRGSDRVQSVLRSILLLLASSSYNNLPAFRPAGF